MKGCGQKMSFPKRAPRGELRSDLARQLWKKEGLKKKSGPKIWCAKGRGVGSSSTPIWAFDAGVEISGIRRGDGLEGSNPRGAQTKKAAGQFGKPSKISDRNHEASSDGPEAKKRKRYILGAEKVPERSCEPKRRPEGGKEYLTGLIISERGRSFLLGKRRAANQALFGKETGGT